MEITKYSGSAWLPSRFDAQARLVHIKRLVCTLLCVAAGSFSALGQNAIQLENSLPGNPSSQWDINGAGDPTIQGFATDISVNVGQTVFFKINTPAHNYAIDIYRMGYYNGLGARKITSVSPSAALPQTQPACITDSATKLYDCGNWGISASWAVPSTATSGIYFAHLVRSDTGGDSHIFFIVRNDSSHSDILYQTADETWQAYNDFGNGSLYGPPGRADIPNRAYKVSYNRPFNTRSFEILSWFFYAEYPMVQWLEANGYDVTYFTGVDAARNGSLIRNHKIYLSVGHDEYWSGDQRTNVEAARDAGVNLAFFSGNEVFWKTRWENSIDGSNTSYRTMVCYKETLANAKIDPSPVWTGSWRDPRFSPPADGGRPENALTGTMFMVNGPSSTDSQNNFSIQVPADMGALRFWRNTSIATLPQGQTAVLPAATLGYEWDTTPANGFAPAGLFWLSSATYSITSDYLLDNGGTYGAGVATHHLTLYRAPSGALVFGSGTIQWPWGLNSNHDIGSFTSVAPGVDVRMQQATVNLLTDMGAQPATLQHGLIPATKSSDTTPPVSNITSPTSGSTVIGGTTYTVAGTAMDAAGAVAGVQVSLDNGTTWHQATGRTSWTYTWMPAKAGSQTILSRAVDDSGNIETPSGGVTVTVAAHDCPCTIWSPSTVPAVADSGDNSGIVLGVRFQTDYDGLITGIRYYKSAANAGPHIGTLWTASGTLLASAGFSGETGSGWQQVNFANPVAVTANTTYVASYFTPTGHYAGTSGYFSGAAADNPPLHALADGVGGANGLYAYSSVNVFPTGTFGSANYWVDAVYFPRSSMPGAPSALAAAPSAMTFAVYQPQSTSAPQTIAIFNQGSATLNWTASASAPWIVLGAASGSTPASLQVSMNAAGLAPGTYNGTVTLTVPGVTGSPQTVAITLNVADLLATSDFSDGTMQGWAFSPLGLASNWTVANQALQYNGGGHTQVYGGNSSWTDYTFQVDVRLSSLNGNPGGFRGRLNPSTGAGYAVWLYPALGIVRLYKNVAWDIDAGFTKLAEAPVGFDSQRFHTCAISFQGTQITVKLDGQAIMSAADSTYASGMIALDVSNQPVAFTNVLVTAPTTFPASLVPSPSSLTFSGNYQGPNPPSQSLQLTSSGAGLLIWTAVSTAPWLTVSPQTGATPGTIQVSVNTAQLAGGTYNGTVNLVALGASNTPQAVNVSLTVQVPPPALALSPASLNFSALTGQANPAQQNLTVSNAGFGSFTWNAAPDSSWLSVSSASGATPNTIGVSVNTTGLATGNYTGNVIFSAPGVANSPQAVPVNLAVLSQDMSENFSAGAPGWIVSPLGYSSGWSAASGIYSFSGIGHTQSCAGNTAWSDYTFTAGVRLSTLSNFPGGIRARVNPATGAGYAVWLYPGTGLVKLFRVPQWNIDDGPTVLLAQASQTFDTTNFHDLRIEFRGSQISVYWDSTFLMTANDSSFASGYVCMDVSNQPISYTNTRVNAVQSRVTLATPSPASLNFASLQGTQPAAQTVSISAGGLATTWGIVTSTAWLTATASSPFTPGTVSVTVNTSGMNAGVYAGSFQVFGPGTSNSPITVPVTLSIRSASIITTPSTLNFFGAAGANSPTALLNITNGGTGSMSWTGSSDSAWLSLNPASGSAPSAVTVSANVAGMATGQYSGNISVSSADALNSPVTVPASLRVGTLLFSDDFSSGSASNWTISPLGMSSGWLVQNGAYTYDGGGHTQSYTGSPSWTDYTVATDVRLSLTTGNPGGLRGRVNTGTGASYGVWIYPAQQVLKLFRIDHWDIDVSNQLLGQSGTLNIDTSTHRLRLSFKGSQIEVYYDEVLVIQATDSTYTQGAIALDVSNSPVSFDNVQVIGY